MLWFLNVLFNYCTVDYCTIKIIINYDPHLSSTAAIPVILVAVSGFYYTVKLFTTHYLSFQSFISQMILLNRDEFFEDRFVAWIVMASHLFRSPRTSTNKCERDNSRMAYFPISTRMKKNTLN